MMLKKIILTAALLTATISFNTSKESHAQFYFNDKTNTESGIRSTEQFTKNKEATSKGASTANPVSSLVLLDPSPKQEGDKPKIDSRYAVIPYANGKSWNIMRYSVKYGDSWVNSDTRWVKMKFTDTKYYPIYNDAMRFVIKTAPMADGSAAVVLLNKFNGYTWFKKNTTWVRFREKSVKEELAELEKRNRGSTPQSASDGISPGPPVAKKPAKRKTANFEVILYASGKSWNIVRYNAVTGDAWINVGERWYRIKSSSPLTGPRRNPATRFEIKVAPLADGSAAIVLLNKYNGDIWFKKDMTWVKFGKK